MFVWDITDGTRKATVNANTRIGAQKAARRMWRLPQSTDVEAFIRRLPDGTPVKPTESAADKVAQRVYSQPTPPRVVEDW